MGHGFIDAIHALWLRVAQQRSSMFAKPSSMYAPHLSICTLAQLRSSVLVRA